MNSSNGNIHDQNLQPGRSLTPLTSLSAFQQYSTSSIIPPTLVGAELSASDLAALEARWLDLSLIHI